MHFAIAVSTYHGIKLHVYLFIHFFMHGLCSVAVPSSDSRAGHDLN
jgi:hypothetical protein